MENRNDRPRTGNGRGNGAGRRDGRRDERAAAAVKHIDEMERRFAKEIEAAAAATQFIDGMPEKAAPAAAAPAEPVAGDLGAEATDVSTAPEEAPAEPAAAAASEQEPEPAIEPEPASVALPTVTVVDQDAVAAILERGRGRAQYTDLAVLDFASFTSPGGGYERGAWAQEEAMCSESFLYNVLKRHKGWYAENRRRNMNCNLYRNRGLVVPRVRFARDRMHAYADVIVVAAPNRRFAKSDYGVADDALEAAMRDRIRFALRIAEGLGHGRVILGAFGCGAFGWDAAVVAPMFLEELSSGVYDLQEVVFAIPKARFNENHEQFAHVLAKFPEKNEVSFADAKVAAAAAAAEPAEDEDDEDWRKYLG